MTTSLFLAYQTNEDYQKMLRANSELFTLFIKEHQLTEFTLHDFTYIGKKIEPITDMKTLVLLELNLYSILQRLTPAYPVQKTPLTLIAIKNENG